MFPLFVDCQWSGFRLKRHFQSLYHASRSQFYIIPCYNPTHSETVSGLHKSPGSLIIQLIQVQSFIYISGDNIWNVFIFASQLSQTYPFRVGQTICNLKTVSHVYSLETWQNINMLLNCNVKSYTLFCGIQLNQMEFFKSRILQVMAGGFHYI